MAKYVYTSEYVEVPETSKLPFFKRFFCRHKRMVNYKYIDTCPDLKGADCLDCGREFKIGKYDIISAMTKATFNIK